MESPVPLTEESPLRSLPAPDTESEEVAYDNIDVEKAVGGGPLPVTILRLPATHGPGDPQRRLHRYLKRMDDHRPVIVLEERHAHWRWTRGYVENVAAAIGLAVVDERAAGRVYNVAESVVYTEAEWVRRLGDAAGWSGEVVAIPETDLPEQLRQPYNFEQDYVVDSTRIRNELGFREAVDEATALERTIEWATKRAGRRACTQLHGRRRSARRVPRVATMTSEYRIETQRLLLRPLSEGDLEAWADFLGDPEATRLLHTPDPVDDPDRLVAGLRRWASMYEEPIGMYAALVRAGAATAGFVGFVQRDMPWGRELELGWLLRRRFWGEGYARRHKLCARSLRPA